MQRHPAWCERNRQISLGRYSFSFGFLFPPSNVAQNKSKMIQWDKLQEKDDPFLFSIIQCSFVSKMRKGIGNTMCSSPICGKVVDISQHNFSPVTAVIVRFRLALQLHKLLRGVCVCMHVFANTMDIFYPFLHVLDSWHLSTLGNFTSKDVLCTPSNPNSFLFFHCLLSLLTKTQRGISSTTLLPGDGGLVFAPHM